MPLNAADAHIAPVVLIEEGLVVVVQQLMSDPAAALLPVVHAIRPAWAKVFCLSVPPNSADPDAPRSLLVRVAASEEDIIDRTAELRTFLAAAAAGVCGAPLLVFGNGRVEQWLEEHLALNAPGLRQPEMSAHIACSVAAFHRHMSQACCSAATSHAHSSFTRDAPESRRRELWQRMQGWLTMAQGMWKDGDDTSRPLAGLQDELAWLERTLDRLVPSCTVFCHNDLQYGNIMAEKGNAVFAVPPPSAAAVEPAGAATDDASSSPAAAAAAAAAAVAVAPSHQLQPNGSSGGAHAGASPQGAAPLLTAPQSKVAMAVPDARTFPVKRGDSPPPRSAGPRGPLTAVTNELRGRPASPQPQHGSSPRSGGGVAGNDSCHSTRSGAVVRVVPATAAASAPAAAQLELCAGSGGLTAVVPAGGAAPAGFADTSPGDSAESAQQGASALPAAAGGAAQAAAADDVVVEGDGAAVKLIDYDYCSYGPAAYDLANHWCEWAGDYHTDTPHLLHYSRFPDLAQQRAFTTTYLAELLSCGGAAVQRSAPNSPAPLPGRPPLPAPRTAPVPAPTTSSPSCCDSSSVVAAAPSGGCGAGAGGAPPLNPQWAITLGVTSRGIENSADGDSGDVPAYIQDLVACLRAPAAAAADSSPSAAGAGESPQRGPPRLPPTAASWEEAREAEQEELNDLMSRSCWPAGARGSLVGEVVSPARLARLAERLRVTAVATAAAAHLHWALWGYVQVLVSEIEFDFVSYADQRMRQYLLMRQGLMGAGGGGEGGL